VLVLLAVCAAPLLLAVAVLAVARGPRLALGILTLALTAIASVITGWLGQVSDTTITALACLTLGVGLTRLIPRSWLALGILATCIIDVVLMGSGMGANASAAMNAATAAFHGPALDRGSIGPISIDYPDLVLTGILGASVAGHRRLQPAAALLLSVLFAAYGMLLPTAGLLPATIPIAATFVLVRPGGRLAARLGHLPSGSDRQPARSSAARSPARSAEPNTTRLRVAT
jgi:hypothetical protein